MELKTFQSGGSMRYRAGSSDGGVGFKDVIRLSGIFGTTLRDVKMYNERSGS